MTSKTVTLYVELDIITQKMFCNEAQITAITSLGFQKINLSKIL